MALTDAGTSFFHVLAILLTTVLLCLFLFFALLSFRNFKILAQKIKLLIATAVRKRWEMATYGVKPNPKYFVSQTQKQQKRQLQAEVQQKRESKFKIVLYYLYDIYNPVICVFHRCAKSRKERKKDQARRSYLERKIQEANQVEELQDDDNLGNQNYAGYKGEDGSNLNIQEMDRQEAQIDLPQGGRMGGGSSYKKQTSIQNILPNKSSYTSEKKESKLHKRKLKQLGQQKELIQVDFLRPSKWFYVLQYMGGLSLNQFLIILFFAIVYTFSSITQTSFALIFGISIGGPFFSSFIIIFFYWYSHHLFRTSIRQTFEKTYISTLIQPLSKPRPHTGADFQGGANQYAMMSGIMYDHHQQFRQVNTLDPELLRNRMMSRGGGDNTQFRNTLRSPLKRGFSSGYDHSPAGGMKSPYVAEKNGQIERNMYGNIRQQTELKEQQQFEDGPGKNLLMNASGNEQLLQRDQIISSDMKGILTKGEYVQIRRTTQDRDTKIADNILLYIAIGMSVFLLIGICAILFVYLSTAFAISSIVCFFIASILEIFFVRPLYILIWALIKKCCQKKKTKQEYDRIDEVKAPLDNPALMDQANQQAAMRQYKEQEKKLKSKNTLEEDQNGLMAQNKSGSNEDIDQEYSMNDRIIDDQNQNKIEKEGKGEDQREIDKFGQKIPEQLGEDDIGADNLGQKSPEKLRDDEKSDDKLGQKFPDKLVDDDAGDNEIINEELSKKQNIDLIQLNNDEDEDKKQGSLQKSPNDYFIIENDQGQRADNRPKVESPQDDNNKIFGNSGTMSRNQPESPFAAGMSYIPRKGTASFDRKGLEQEDDIDQVAAHLIVSPDKNLRSNNSPQDDEAQGFRSQSPQNLRRNQDGIPERKVDTKNQSYTGPEPANQEDLQTPLLVPASKTGGFKAFNKNNKVNQEPQPKLMKGKSQVPRPQSKSNKQPEMMKGKSQVPRPQSKSNKEPEMMKGKSQAPKSQAPKSQSRTINRTENSQYGGQFQGKDSNLNDHSGEILQSQRYQQQARGGSAVPFKIPSPLPSYNENRQETGPVNQGIGDDEPMQQLMNEYAQTDLPPFTIGRRASPDITGIIRPASRLSALSPFGDVSKTGSIPQDAEINQMMMNPLDDLCPYKQVMTDVIYLSCGPQGGDQVLNKLKKKPGAQDISINDLQKIIDQNNYEINPDITDSYQDSEQHLQIKPGIKPVIPIDEYPAEDQITSSMPHSPVHSQTAINFYDPNVQKQLPQQQQQQQQQQRNELTDSQLIENEMQIKQQEEQASKNVPQERDVDVSFAAQQIENDKGQMFSIQDAVGENAAVGENQNLDDEFKSPLQDQVIPTEDVNKSKSSVRYLKTATPQPFDEREELLSINSPSPIPSTAKPVSFIQSQRKSVSPAPSLRKTPSPDTSFKDSTSLRKTPSPKKVLMGAAIAPNARKPTGQKSFQLDMADMSGTIIMSAESGGRTPPGIQASQGFFINGPDGSQDLSPVGKNRSPLLHGKKKKKKSLSPLRAKPDHSRKGPKARGILATKPEDQNIEYDQGDHQDSQEIDPTSVFFKQGMGLPFDQQVSDQDYGEADIVYDKDDLTNYSRGLGINRVMNPVHSFGRRNKTKKPVKNQMRHSWQAGRAPTLSTHSQDQNRVYPRASLNRSFRSLGPVRTPSRTSSPYDPYGQKRVDCWNHDYIMLNQLETKKPRKKKKFKKSPSYKNVQPHVYDHLSSNRLLNGEDDYIDRRGSGSNLQNPLVYRSGIKGSLPPMAGGRPSSSRINKKAKKRGSKDASGQALWFPNNMANSSSKGRLDSDRMSVQMEQNRLNYKKKNQNYSPHHTQSQMQSVFPANLAPGANVRGRQNDQSLYGSRMLQDDDFNGNSPYNQNLTKRFNQWRPGKDTKQSKRRHLNQIKADQLYKNYGGPLQVTGMAMCGGVRPSQRKKWQKQHRLLEHHRSQMFKEDINATMGNSPPLPPHNMQRQHSNRSSRSSLPPFPPQPQANFDPKFYQQYDSDASGRLRINNNFNSSKLNRSGVLNTSSHSPIPRNQHSSIDSTMFPNIPPNGGVINSTVKNQKRKKKSNHGGTKGNKNYDPLFNPESNDQKFEGSSKKPIFDSPSIRSDNPVENMASPVNFGSPDDGFEEMSDDVRFKSGLKMTPRQESLNNPGGAGGGLPIISKQHDPLSENDSGQVQDI